MARASAAGWAIAVLLAVPMSIAPLLAQTPPSSLTAVVARLGLTGPGIQEWLGRLGVAGDRPVHERLLAVSSTGEILGALDGLENSVVVTPEFDGQLVREGASIVLVHNHPANTSLSQQDLGQLEKAGVTAIIAVGHDGSVYAAAKRLSSAKAQRCSPECYSKAREEVSKTLRIELPRMATNAEVAASFATHLTMLALAKAGYFDYFAALPSERRAIFDTHIVEFSRVVASARAVVEK